MDRRPVTETWRDRAACGNLAAPGYDPWHEPVGTEGAYAKRVCRTLCPVREECLEYSLVNAIPHGIWGGEGVVDRRRLSKAGGYPDMTHYSPSPILASDVVYKKKDAA